MTKNDDNLLNKFGGKFVQLKLPLDGATTGMQRTLTISDIDHLAKRSVNPFRSGDPILDDLNRYPAWIGADPYYRFLMSLSNVMKPWVMLELGVYMGVGSGYMINGFKSADVIGVDIDLHAFANVIHDHFYPRLKWIIADTIAAVPEVESYISNTCKHNKIGLMFIDAEHRTQRVIDELNAYKHLLEPGCVICFDDVRAPAMSELWDALLLDKIRLDYLHTYNDAGFGAAIYRGQNEVFDNHTA